MMQTRVISRNSAGNYVDANGKELMVGGQPFSANGLTDAQMKDPAIQKYIEMVNGKPTLNLDKYMAIKSRQSKNEAVHCSAIVVITMTPKISPLPIFPFPHNGPRVP